MVQGLVRWLVRTLVSLVVWVFILSMQWEGRTLFDRAHELIVDNAAVAMLDAELADWWDKLASTARLALAGMGQNDEKMQ